MRRIEDVVNEVSEMIASEQQRLEKENKEGGSSGHLATISRARLDVLYELKEFICLD